MNSENECQLSEIFTPSRTRNDGLGYNDFCFVCLFVCLCILHQSCLTYCRDSELSYIRETGFQSAPP